VNVDDKKLKIFFTTIDEEKTNLNTSILPESSILRVTNPVTSQTFEYGLSQV
jgi:hypothetical protein